MSIFIKELIKGILLILINSLVSYIYSFFITTLYASKVLSVFLNIALFPSLIFPVVIVFISYFLNKNYIKASKRTFIIAHVVFFLAIFISAISVGIAVGNAF